jgi:hypothetical protein
MTALVIIGILVGWLFVVLCAGRFCGTNTRARDAAHEAAYARRLAALRAERGQS